MAVDKAARKMYIADPSNHAIRLMDLDTHSVSTLVGGAGSTIMLDLTFPCGVAIDPSVQPPRLYIADTGSHVVYSVDLAQQTAFIAAGGAPSKFGSPSSGALDMPYGLVVDGSGDLLYIADSGNHVIRLLTVPTGALSTVAGVPGSGGRGGDGGPALRAQLQLPCGIAVEAKPRRPAASRHLYIADTQNHAVRSLDLDTHILTTVAGVLGSGGREGDGNQATTAQLYFPYSVAVDAPAEQLYIADNWNHAIRLVDLATGLLTTLAGVVGSYGTAGDLGRANQALMHFPQGLLMDTEARRLYVADSGNHAIRLVALSDEVRSNLSKFGLV